MHQSCTKNRPYYTTQLFICDRQTVVDFLCACDIISGMSEKLNLQPLSGMPEWPPAAQLIFERWKQTVRDSYSLFGYTPLETATIERSEVLMAKVGASTGKQIYRFAKGETQLALRFDLTVPLARFVALHQNELTFPFRRQAIGRVFRGERAQMGRFREFYQADADIIGRGSLSLQADAEILSLAVETVRRLQLGNFQLQISNRKIVMGFLSALKVMDQKAIIQLLDDADKIGPKKLQAELKLLRLDTFEIRKIVKFAQIRGNFHQVSQALLRLDVDNALFNEGLEELHQLSQQLEALRLDPTEYQFNLGIIRGLDYYTGMIYETILLDHPSLGSICSGGRYDNLVGNYGKTKMPGVGCSIGLTRLFAQALEAGLLSLEQKTVSQVVVIPLTEQLDHLHDIVSALRQSGIPTDVYLETGGMKKALKYAASLGVPYALIIGDDELTQKKLSLKNLVTGDQESLNLAQVINTLQS